VVFTGLAERQRPAECGMKAEAGGKNFVRLKISSCRYNPKGCIDQRKLKVQLKSERVMAEGFFIPIQPEMGARRVSRYKRKQPIPRKAMPGERIYLAVQPVLIAGERANNGKQDRRPAFPDGRIARPLQITAQFVPEGKKLCAERVNFRGQLRGGNPDQGMIDHGYSNPGTR